MKFPSFDSTAEAAGTFRPRTGTDALTDTQTRFVLRSSLFFGTVLIITLMSTVLMGDFLVRTGWNPLKGFLLGSFFILFGYATYGFCHAWFGFWTLRSHQTDPGLITSSLKGKDPALQHSRTAIITPIYQEDVEDVCQRLKANFLSLKATGELEHFDFFLLSDSQDPEIWAREEVAWIQLCQEVEGFGRIYYRRRTNNAGKKAGNVAEFCRSWGKRYDYMIVLDADSIMSGETAVKMARLMEVNPKVGLIQTVPRLCNAETFFGRVQQFAMRFYGKIFIAGLNYWQQNNGNYWGHNAIIRMKPFIKYCDLPQLPGRKPFGGHILSHDFVEAALLRRAGWDVWLAPCLGESYEEGPPGLSESAVRDRRWCGGNMQHSMLLFADRLKAASRIHLAGGIMGYLASPLWLCFLGLSTFIALHQGGASDLSNSEPSALPGFEAISANAHGLIILGLTLMILFLPKLLAVIDLFFDSQRAEAFGGKTKAAASVAIESLFSAMLAPILMLLHTRFVIENLTGVSIGWDAQKRSSEGMSWADATRQHRWHTLLGLSWGAVAWWISPVFFWWISPVLLGISLSIPIAYYSSRTSLGEKFQRWGLFLTPEETQRPEVLRQARLEVNSSKAKTLPNICDTGFREILLDPYVNALHVSLLEAPCNRKGDSHTCSFDAIMQQACNCLLSHGPHTLPRERITQILLCDEALRWLHTEIWRRPSHKLADYWTDGLERYHSLLKSKPLPKVTQQVA